MDRFGFLKSTVAGMAVAVATMFGLKPRTFACELNPGETHASPCRHRNNAPPLTEAHADFDLIRDHDGIWIHTHGLRQWVPDPLARHMGRRLIEAADYNESIAPGSRVYWPAERPV